MTGTFGNDVISTPCMEEMATFDQFVEHLQNPDSEIVVFDTAPTGKTLRELAIPVHKLIVNQVIPEQVIRGNEFLQRRSQMQQGFLEEIQGRFNDKEQIVLPQLMQDLSNLEGLRAIGELLYGGHK